MNKMSAAYYKRFVNQQRKAHEMQQAMKKKAHGGKRKGSGRPKGEPTITMRIPVSKVEQVKKLILAY